MVMLSRLLSALLLLLVASVATAEATEATLTYGNRTIIVFRGDLAGATPPQRVARALLRIEEAERRESTGQLTRIPVTLGTQQGVGVFAGDLLLFTVLPADLPPDDTGGVQGLAQDAQLHMQGAFAAWHAQENPVLLGKALLRVLIACVLAAVIARLVWHLRKWVSRRLQAFVARKLAGELPWIGYLVKVFERVMQIIMGLLLFAIAYLLLTYDLSQFPLTQPFAASLGHFLIDLLAGIGRSAVRSLPGLVTIVVILVITRALVQSVHAIFDAVQQGRIEFPGLHRETLSATRRIVVVSMWALGFTFCYPYIPGSQSDVFKGLSVLFGFMLTLGSSGIVSQLMSGMTLVYSRALRKGDLVRVGETTGVVQEVGSLSTKLLNLYGEEVTIPNTVLVSNQIHNLSRQHESKGIWTGCKVSIGYDTPWRQVEAMLLNAAARVDDVASAPAPFVLQRALGDFYVEYELFAVLRAPLRRFFVQDRLYREIQDEFNRHGVQIMSPHFMTQPEQAVVVPPQAWRPAPADNNKDSKGEGP